ncbi:MAG: hypothetical protein HKN12_12490 [Gemmatimonadetes bacterium]|nr:hypothetical protein [Gemmatimonadota bacterium]
MKRNETGRVLRVGTLSLAALLLGAALIVAAATEAGADEAAPSVAAEAGISTASDDAGSGKEAKPAKKAVQGSDAKGKYWFKKSCKDCHIKGGDGGEVTPLSKTIKQWERYFRKEMHHGEEPLLDVVDEEQLLHIKTFLINHAADSDQPETCG